MSTYNIYDQLPPHDDHVKDRGDGFLQGPFSIPADLEKRYEAKLGPGPYYGIFWWFPAWEHYVSSGSLYPREEAERLLAITIKAYKNQKTD